MTAKEIKILMELLDVTQTSVAQKLGVTLPAVHSVIKGLRHNPRIRQAIADAVGRPVEQIWPPEKSNEKTDTLLNQKHTKNSDSKQANS